MTFRVTQSPKAWHLGVPCVEERTAEFATVELAEKRARYWTKRFGYESEIFHVTKKGKLAYVATTLTDALGKTWTQVSEEGGRFL